MSVTRDHPVRRFDGPSHGAKAPGDGQRAKEGHGRSDPEHGGAPAFPPTVAIADVHHLEEDPLRRGVVQLDRGTLEWKKAERMPTVEPVEGGGRPGAEAAVGVEEDDEPGRIGSRHDQLRTIICARSGPTLTWLIRTPARPSRRST